MAVRVYILVATFAIAVTCCYGWGYTISAWNVCHAASHVVLYNTRLDTCTWECAVRDSCVAVQYQRMEHSCGILTSKQLQTPLGTCKKFTYMYIRRIHFANEPETCGPYIQSGTGDSCITECNVPANLQAYASIEGFPFLGSRIKVTCDARTIHVGDHYLICTDSGEFSGSVPVCQFPSGTNFMNIALQKPAWQSSTRLFDHASLAVDGGTSGNHGDRSCSHTVAGQREGRPWWVVDFGLPYIIKRVTVYNRLDCCSNRFADVYIYASTTDSLSNGELSGTLCASDPGPFSQPVITFQCQDNVVGRYLKIILDRTMNSLAMCEVHVQAQAIV